MKETLEPMSLETLSLGEMVQLLLDGHPVHRTNDSPFRLDTEDKCKIFAFYSRNLNNWDKSRQIRENEIENLLRALREDLPETCRKESHKAKGKPIWHLSRIEIHRFAGLHRHLGAKGEEPDDLVLDMSSDLMLVSGFNGAGKTALLSAIIWCLTGKALRSQDVPQEVHEPMTVKQASNRVETEDQIINGPDFDVPPIVPIPSDEDLKILKGNPKLDTRVKLNFTREDSGEVQVVSRRLEVKGKKVTAPVEGLNALGLPALALEVGTLMPGIASQMRFNEKTDLAQAVSELTGLKPLEEFGLRSLRMVVRLRNDETTKTSEERKKHFERFEAHLQKLDDRWNEHPDLGEKPDILLPGLSRDQQDCQSTVLAARTRMINTRKAMGRDVESILGGQFDFTNRHKVTELGHALDNATDQLKHSALREVPTIGRLSCLKEVSDCAAESALNLINDVLRRAVVLSKRLENERTAARWILYSRVAAWHKDFHEEEEITNCPVCGTDLDCVPIDALVDTSVKSALDQCLTNDSDSAKTASEWEQHESVAFLDALPSSIRDFADSTLPDTLIAFYHKGFVDELLAQSAFQGALRSLQDSARVLWGIAVEALPPPDPPVQPESELPQILSNGKLQKRLFAIARALMLRTHLKSAEGHTRLILESYIGSVTSTEEVDQTSTLTDGTIASIESDELDKRKAPIMEQINAVRRGVKNITPILSLVGQLDALESKRKEWEAQTDRLLLLERAAKAIESFRVFPELVHDRITGLIRTLNSNTANWLDRIYSAHYRGGPVYGGFEPREGGKFEVSAKFGEMYVPAHQVMNASLLKACVWAFLFALWEHVRKQSGVLACMLLDDPQTHFDLINNENLARAIPAMPRIGMRPLITCNDNRFLAHIRSELRSTADDSFSWATFRINPISSSRHTASVSPTVDEICQKKRFWLNDENDVSKAQDFVKCVRVDIEERLVNLLANDPLLMHSPTLGEILNRLRATRKAGELPFCDPPFKKATPTQ